MFKSKTVPNEAFRTVHLNEMQLNRNTQQNMPTPQVGKQNEKQNNARARCRNKAQLHIELGHAERQQNGNKTNN